MTEERSQTSATAEQTSSANEFDDVAQSVDELTQTIEDVTEGGTILLDEAGTSTSGRRSIAAAGEDHALRRDLLPSGGTTPFDTDLGLDTSVDDPLNLSRSVSNEQLERRLNAHGRRLKDVEERLDDVAAALDGLVDVLAGEEQRPVGDVLQDVLDDEMTQREAAAELGWSRAKVSRVINQIHE